MLLYGGFCEGLIFFVKIDITFMYGVVKLNGVDYPYSYGDFSTKFLLQNE